MVNLGKIKEALAEISGSDEAMQCIETAICQLQAASVEMNDMTVKGRKDIDALLGCMIGIDLIIGGNKKDG
jgi:hypothetical protein